jgi:hypothetical protein
MHDSNQIHPGTRIRETGEADFYEDFPKGEVNSKIITYFQADTLIAGETLGWLMKSPYAIWQTFIALFRPAIALFRPVFW